jgi:hypothetical protein
MKYKDKDRITVMKLIFILLSFSMNSAFAYTPSLESLLRNGNNIDVGNNTVLANLSILEIDPENNLPLKEDNIVNKETIKLLILNEKEDYPKLCQVNYKGGVMNSVSLINYKERSFKKLNDVIKNDENVDGQFFYATLSMLLNNNGSMLIEYLKKYNSKIKLNTELVNKNKSRLLKKYKSYLIASRDDEEGKLENPLKPLAEDKKEKVTEIKNANFLDSDPLVKKIKVEDQFFWIIDNNGLYARFDNDHRLRELRVKTGVGEVELVLGKFVIHGSQIEFPEFIWFKSVSGKKYEIKATKVSMFQDTRENHTRRIKRYSKASEENKLVAPEVKLDFIL